MYPREVGQGWILYFDEGRGLPYIANAQKKLTYWSELNLPDGWCIRQDDLDDDAVFLNVLTGQTTYDQNQAVSPQPPPGPPRQLEPSNNNTNNVWFEYFLKATNTEHLKQLLIDEECTSYDTLKLFTDKDLEKFHIKTGSRKRILQFLSEVQQEHEDDGEMIEFEIDRPQQYGDFRSQRSDISQHSQSSQSSQRSRSPRRDPQNKSRNHRSRSRSRDHDNRNQTGRDNDAKKNNSSSSKNSNSSSSNKSNSSSSSSSSNNNNSNSKNSKNSSSSSATQKITITQTLDVKNIDCIVNNATRLERFSGAGITFSGANKSTLEIFGSIHQCEMVADAIEILLAERTIKGKTDNRSNMLNYTYLFDRFKNRNDITTLQVKSMYLGVGPPYLFMSPTLGKNKSEIEENSKTIMTFGSTVHGGKITLYIMGELSARLNVFEELKKVIKSKPGKDSVSGTGSGTGSGSGVVDQLSTSSTTKKNQNNANMDLSLEEMVAANRQRAQLQNQTNNNNNNNNTTTSSNTNNNNNNNNYNNNNNNNNNNNYNNNNYNNNNYNNNANGKQQHSNGHSSSEAASDSYHGDMSARVTKLVTFLLRKEKNERVRVCEIGKVITSKVRKGMPLEKYLKTLGFSIDRTGGNGNHWVGFARNGGNDNGDNGDNGNANNDNGDTTNGPPTGYICRICNVAGHFIQHCPQNHGNGGSSPVARTPSFTYTGGNGGFKRNCKCGNNCSLKFCPFFHPRDANSNNNGNNNGNQGYASPPRQVSTGYTRDSPPNGYVCKKCKVPGHFMNECSLYTQTPQNPKQSRHLFDHPCYKFQTGNCTFGNSCKFRHVFERSVEQQSGDWLCSRCSSNNFSRRTVCFKCQNARQNCVGQYSHEHHNQGRARSRSRSRSRGR